MRWKEVSFFGERGDAEEERMGWRGRTVGRGHSRVGGAGVRDSPPTSCSLGLWGRSGHRSDCHAGGDLHRGWWGGLASASSPPPGGARRLPAEPFPPPCPVPAPLGASCAPLEEVGIGVFPLQPHGLVGCG